MGFDASDLQPQHAGIYTYGSQLLQHLRQLPDAPSITLLEGLTPGSNRASSMEGSDTSTLQAARSRHIELLLGAHGAALAAANRVGVAEEYKVAVRATAKRIWWTVSGSPRSCAWLLPQEARDLDLYHWSHALFLPMPRAANVVIVHDTIPLEHPEWVAEDHARRERHRLKLAGRYADRILVVSYSTRDAVVRQLGSEIEDRVDVTPLGVSPDLLRPVAAEREAAVLSRYGLTPGNYLLSLGTIEPRRNLPTLVRAFTAALPDLPTDMKLVLAGRTRPGCEDIVQRLKASGLGHRMVLAERVPQEDLPALMHGARAAATVSLHEGFGLPALESMAQGTPSIASNTTSLPEVVGDSALLVNPLDTADIARALLRLATDASLRQELSARSRARARQFTWARTAQLTFDSYLRALDARRKSKR